MDVEMMVCIDIPGSMMSSRLTGGFFPLLKITQPPFIGSPRLTLGSHI